MSDWYKVYLEQIEKNDGCEKYIQSKISQKRKLIKLLLKHSGNGKVIEAGCGTGIISAYLASKGFDVTAIDVDQNILSLAKELEEKFYSKNLVNFKNQSIFDLDYKEDSFDLCYSVGVLEHFSDEEIVNLLSKQIKLAKKTIVVIPTKWFNDDETLHGDDRFLELSHWRKLISQSGGKIIKESSYPFKGKGFAFLKRLKRIFRPKAYKIFIICKNND